MAIRHDRRMAGPRPVPAPGSGWCRRIQQQVDIYQPKCPPRRPVSEAHGLKPTFTWFPAATPCKHGLARLTWIAIPTLLSAKESAMASSSVSEVPSR